MKKLLSVAIIALTLASAASAQSWYGQVLGGGNSLEGRVLVSPSARAKAGLAVGWADGLDGNKEALQCAAVGTWDILQDVNLPFVLPFGSGQGTIKASTYLGVEIGAIRSVHGDPSYAATAAGLIGLVVGEPAMQIGVEYCAAVSDHTWSALADGPGSSVRMFVAYRFK